MLALQQLESENMAKNYLLRLFLGTKHVNIK